ncbi:MAG: hypothetical protein F6K50_17480 [Moorea sp. SIO3I7]|nr:hypothetical protein [Moorena sp. SIO3I7]
MSGSPKLVRYGADYTNPGDEAKNKGKSAPNTPYFLTLKPWPLATLREQPNNLGLWPRYANNLGLLATLREQPANFQPANLQPLNLQKKIPPIGG